MKLSIYRNIIMCIRKLILACFVVLIACSSNKSQPQDSVEQLSRAEADFFNYISKAQLPEKLDWCGEEIPLDDPEIRERAEREFYLLLQQPGQIMLYIKRSGRYFPLFERILREYSMPDEIKYMAVAESALYMSTSSKGAHGLWQFMESTGKKMGLIIDSYVDERRHPEKSTRAALNYLKQGYDANGSWILAAAGYNMGHTGVNSSLKKQYSNNYFDLFLNQETSRFIFRIALIKELMLYAKKYGFHVEEKNKYQPYDYKIIKWNSSIPDIAEWAKTQGTNYKQLKLMNLWMIKSNLPSPPKGKSWEIYVPK